MASNILSELVAAIAGGKVKVVDLTQTLKPSTPVIQLPPPLAQSDPFSISVISKYDERGPGWYWNNLKLGEHTGTHFDAPVHWVTGKDLADNACDTIPARRFVGPACVIDITAEVEANPDFLLMPGHIEGWEATHGRISSGAWVLLRSGWSRRTDAASFLNVGADGPHSPGCHASASRLLARERDVLGIGVETVGTDAGQAATFDPPFPNHTIMHGAGKYGLASLRNLDQLPAVGAIVIAAPLKVVGGSGSPLRVIAIVPT